MSGRRTLAGLALAAAGTAAIAARIGWRPALPGTDEPGLRPLEPGERSWLEAIAGDIDPAALRTTVESMPGPRNRFGAREAITAFEDRLSRAMAQPGWTVERRPFVFEDVPAGGFDHNPHVRAHDRLDGINLLAVKEGRESRDAVVVVAHYDTVEDTPGADDNGASLAALLELGRILGRHTFRRTLMLAATDMEEIGLFGAYALAPQLTAERRIIGAVCFDTMAYTATAPGTQTFPPGVDLLYPSQTRRLRSRGLPGDTTVIVYNGSAIPLARAFGEALVAAAGREAVLLLRDPRDLPGTGRILRRAMPAVRNFSRSDHRAFWDAGVPAILVSDTANFRYPDYHQPSDTPDKLDYGRLAAITASAAAAVARMAGRIAEEPAGS